MIDPFTYPPTKHIQDDLSDDEEERPKREIAQRPPILQSVQHQNDLHDKVHGQADGVDNVQDDEKAGCVGWRESRPSLERQEADGKADDENDQTAESQKPDRQGGPVFVQLKADKPVDQKTRAESARQTILHRREPGKGAFTGGLEHAGIQHQADDRQQTVDVEECQDLFPAHRRKLRPHVEDHDGGHGQGGNVRKVGCGLEYDGVGQLDGPGTACWQ